MLRVAGRGTMPGMRRLPIALFAALALPTATRAREPAPADHPLFRAFLANAPAIRAPYDNCDGAGVYCGLPVEFRVRGGERRLVFVAPGAAPGWAQLAGASVAAPFSGRNVAAAHAGEYLWPLGAAAELDGVPLPELLADPATRLTGVAPGAGPGSMRFDFAAAPDPADPRLRWLRGRVTGSFTLRLEGPSVSSFAYTRVDAGRTTRVAGSVGYGPSVGGVPVVASFEKVIDPCNGNPPYAERMDKLAVRFAGAPAARWPFAAAALVVGVALWGWRRRQSRHRTAG